MTLRFLLFSFTALTLGCANSQPRETSYSFSDVAADEVQSRFIGPVRLHVWKSWLDSDNVEDDTGDTNLYEFTRGNNADVPFVRLEAKLKLSHPRVKIDSCYLERSGQWEMHSGEDSIIIDGKINDQKILFFKQDTSLKITDVSEKRLIKKISFEIFEGASPVYSATILPMYVRGERQHYWKNAISGFESHAGSGSMSIATSLKAYSDWEEWGGQKIHPVVDFIEKQGLSNQAIVGLHRMEHHQKIWLIDSGTVVVSHGVSYQQGMSEQILKPWPGTDTKKETTQFAATGGWIEERVLKAGEMMVMVPDPKNKKQVSFQGMKAISASSFWVMGQYN